MQAGRRDGGVRIKRRDHHMAEVHPILLWVAEASRESRAAAARRHETGVRQG
jgi:hypothetical protein